MDPFGTDMTDQKRTYLIWMLLGSLVLSSVLSSCVSTGPTGDRAAKTLPASRMNSAAVQRRNQIIATEPRGDHYIGRRWFTEGTRYWGFIRRPGEPWTESKLFVMNESVKLQPDRVHETPSDGGPAHGYDHNWEYRLWGSFTGSTIYDPNSDLSLPEFKLQKYEVISQNPGFLFYPGEPYKRRGLPPKHPPKP